MKMAQIVSFRLQSLAFCLRHLCSSVRTEKTTTWLCRRGIMWHWSNSVSEHAFKNRIFVKGFESAQYVLQQRRDKVIKLEYWPPETDKGGPCRRDHRGSASQAVFAYTQSSVVSTAGKCLTAQTPSWSLLAHRWENFKSSPCKDTGRMLEKINREEMWREKNTHT